MSLEITSPGSSTLSLEQPSTISAVIGSAGAMSVSVVQPTELTALINQPSPYIVVMQAPSLLDVTITSGYIPSDTKISPDFSYTGDLLTRIDYINGSYSLLTYGVDDLLTRVDYINNGVTVRKDFSYTGDQLDFMLQTTL